jgi:hydroxymethylglutaryl-CoA synthase
MKGILSYGSYIPQWRLARSEIPKMVGTGGGSGTRSVASFDEDTTTLGYEAARLALHAAPSGISPSALWFTTVTPAYTDKANATAIHAALRLTPEVMAADLSGSVRSSIGALCLALQADAPSIVVAADLRNGLPGSSDESEGGDAGAALLVGEGPVIAEFIGNGSSTAEFTERWRTPGALNSSVWEDRFGETKYVPFGEEAWAKALKNAGLSSDDIDHVIVTGSHKRSLKALPRRLGVQDHLFEDMGLTVGWTGAASPALLLGACLDHCSPDQNIAVVSLADGADVLIFRTTPTLASFAALRPANTQAAAGRPLPYGKYLTWRGHLTVQPPNRPEPSRVSSSAAARTGDWKFSLTGHSDVLGTITTFTIDRMAHSPNPPVVFAIVDFDDGRRQSIELTDVDPNEIAIGQRVEMTFRRLFTAGGIHNYFWKARLAR